MPHSSRERKAVEILVPCKVNLFLDVRGRRPNGYHDLETLFLPLFAPHDLLRIARRRHGQGLRFSCSDNSLETPDNLAVKAYERFARATGFAPDLSVHLEKHIPHGAGLGGGSSDAAALLRHLNDAAGPAALSEAALGELAVSLGADAPFFLLARPALGSGLGEILTPLDLDLAGLSLLLACPGTKVSTAEAYRALDAARNPEKMPPESLTRAIGKNTRCVCVTTAPLFNSFEPVVFAAHPELRRLKERFYALGAAAALMSGSGSSVFGLFRNHAVAVTAAAAFRKDNVATFLSRL